MYMYVRLVNTLLQHLVVDGTYITSDFLTSGLAADVHPDGLTWVIQLTALTQTGVTRVATIAVVTRTTATI